MLLLQTDMNTTTFPARRVAGLLAAVLSFAIGLPVSVVAQTPTLAEIARKEQDRRKAVKAPARVYTNKDLPATAAPAPVAAPPPQAAAAAAVTPVDPAKPKEEQKDEAWWRARMTQVREEVRRNEIFAEALQTRINSLSADVVNRDDPAQRAKMSSDRQTAVAELDRVKTEIELGKKRIADIEEEARVAAVPPGWVR